MKLSLLFFLCCLLAFQLTGCQTGPPAITKQVIPLAISSAQDLVGVINDRAAYINSLKASGTITIYEPAEKPLSYPVIVMFKKPNKFYLKSHKPLTPTIFEVKSERGKFYTFIPQDNVIFTGKNETLNNNPNYDISLTPEVFLQSLFARRVPATAQVRMKETDEYYELSLLEKRNNLPTLSRKIWADRETAQCIEEVHFTTQGIMLFNIKRGNFSYDKNSAQKIAHALYIKNIRDDIAIEFAFKKIFLNEEIDNDIFNFEFPKGVDIEEVL